LQPPTQKQAKSLSLIHNHIYFHFKFSKFGVEELPVNPDETPTDHSEPEVLENKFLREEILNSSISINKKSDSLEKIKLFMSLFRGRDDVYAKRWENNKKGTAGYSPACDSEWKSGICQKPKISCSECKNKDYLPLN